MTSVKCKAWLTVAMACICAGGTPLYAKEAPDYSAFSDEELRAHYEKHAEAKNSGHCKVLTPLLNEMAKRVTFQPNVNDVKFLTTFQCAIDQARYKDAFAISTDVERIVGVPFPNEFTQALAAAADEEYPARMDGGCKNGCSKGSKPLAKPDRTWFWPWLSELVQSKTEDIRLQMFRTLELSALLEIYGPNERSIVAQEWLIHDAENGDFSRVKMLGQELRGPYPFLQLLTDKSLEPAWPQLEEVAGPNLQKIADANIIKSAAAYNANPDDRQAFNFYVQALGFAGKFEDAIALVRTFDHSPEAMLNAAEDDLWAINIEALALDALGRHGEAEAVFDAMAALPFEGERKFWLHHFIINRASRLVNMGQWQKGLDATMLAHQVAEQEEVAEYEEGLSWQKMAIRTARICALVNLGRQAEAAPLLTEAYERREDGYASAARAYLCAGNDDKAAAIVLEALDNPDHQDDMALNLQKIDLEIFYVPETLPSLRDRLRSRPEIDAAFNKIARDLPERLIPGASIRRRQIAQGK